VLKTRFAQSSFNYRALARGRLGRNGRLKCTYLVHLLDQSDTDFAQNFGKLQTLSISE